MTAAWQARLAGGAEGALQVCAAQLSRPPVQRLLGRGAVLLLLFWLLHSIVTALWSFLPSAEPLPAFGAAINPALPAEATAANVSADIDALLAARLFGTADAAALAAAAQAQPPVAETIAADLGGIEDDAAQTRLPLRLMGVVSAVDHTLAQAVIEHRNEQRRYRIGDELPVSGSVTLAKVMPTQVVLDNGGRYELLRLFDDSTALSGAAVQSATGAVPRARPAQAAGAAGVAAAYRQRLYSDPESLAELVTVSDVRANGELIGYRLQPGRAAAEFAALGFRSGDLVTAVNGLPLSDPANALRLYQAMRSADRAVFDLQRGNETLSVTVDLDAE